MKKESAFMHWAKTRPKVKYDLALSGILNLPIAELEFDPKQLELHGDNAYGYRPLVEALAKHRNVAPKNVVTVSGGTSLANHLAMAALTISLGPEFVVTSSLTKGYGLSGLRCGWIFAEPKLAEKIRRLDDIFAASAPHVMERLSLAAITQLPKIAARAKSMLETNRQTLRKFSQTRYDVDPVPTKFGTTSFPRIRNVDVEKLCDLL